MYDAVVIGGSFAGLSAAMYMARARLRVCIVDAGLPRNRFASHAHGFLGSDGRSPSELLEESRAQVLAYPTVSLVKDEAVGAEKTADGFEVTLLSGEKLSARKLVLAMGVNDLLPEMEGMQGRWGTTVLHCPYCHGYELDRKDIGVIATSPISLHHASVCADFGKTTFFTNGLDIVDEKTERQLSRLGVTIERALIQRIEGSTEDPAAPLAGVRLADGRLVPVCAVFVLPNVALTDSAAAVCAQLGVAFAETPIGRVIATDAATKMTNVPGVYAAGDVQNMKAALAFAVADGALAGIMVHQTLVTERKGL